MARRSTVPWIGVLLAMTVVVLADPLIKADRMLIPLAVVVAGVAAFAISSGINRISAGTPRSAAWTTAVVLVAACIAVGIAMASKRTSSVQSLVLAFGPFVLFRLVAKSMDRFIDEFTLPLVAGMIAVAVFAGAVPLIAYGHPGLPIWPAIGIGAGLGFAEGLVSGALLWRMVPKFLR
ncbi:hypothetical protein ACFWUU_25695 [Kribbella sp. NPDC058693]|uniref:hypothetical protein n=1 Tax=Kribbella sp. NPDC058693 TaxID=3346602 RepID=UPI003663A4B9